MEWILDHLQILIAAGAAVAYWLNQRQQANAENEQSEDGSQRETMEASDEAEQARRIREEIRRKIAERAGGGGGLFELPPKVEPPPLFQREEVQPEPVFESFRDKQSWDQGSGYLVEADPAVLEHQRKMQEQLKALNIKRESEKKVVATPRQLSPIPNAIQSLRSDLRNTRKIRRAIVLREVLGPPVALR